VNALDNVVIPAIIDTVSYITSELDEVCAIIMYCVLCVSLRLLQIEREEFFRLKKVLKVKEKVRVEQAAEEAAAIKAFADAEAIKHPQSGAPGIVNNISWDGVGSWDAFMQVPYRLEPSQ
jgi:hypothetical protein